MTRGRFRAAASVLAATTAVALVSALVAGGTGGSRTLRSVARASSHSSGPTGHARRGPTASSPAGSAGGSGTDLEPGSATTAPAASAGGAPVISAISPAQGLAGQTVVLSGSNFMSSDGQILAEFAGHPAPTDCPVQTSCTVTVPEIAGSVSEVGVTLTTASGTSNAVSFTYG